MKQNALSIAEQQYIMLNIEKGTQAIADHLGRTYQSVYGFLYRNKLIQRRTHKWCDNDLITIRNKYPIMTAKELAAEIGCNANEIYRWVRLLNVDKRGKGRGNE